jgi:hypothetical protein
MRVKMDVSMKTMFDYIRHWRIFDGAGKAVILSKPEEVEAQSVELTAGR